MDGHSSRLLGRLLVAATEEVISTLLLPPADPESEPDTLRLSPGPPDLNSRRLKIGRC
jgi:hypothetical protein